jgi:hypothetical protein
VVSPNIDITIEDAITILNLNAGVLN